MESFNYSELMLPPIPKEKSFRGNRNEAYMELVAERMTDNADKIFLYNKKISQEYYNQWIVTLDYWVEYSLNKISREEYLTVYNDLMKYEDDYLYEELSTE